MKEIISKPWGHEYLITSNDKYAGKILYINKGERLSRQYHNKKRETLYLVKGSALININDTTKLIKNKNILKGQIIEIEPKTIHRIEAIEDCIFFEISTSELDDVVRLEDDYDR